jgi:hypothetical protein
MKRSMRSSNTGSGTEPKSRIVPWNTRMLNFGRSTSGRGSNKTVLDGALSSWAGEERRGRTSCCSRANCGLSFLAEWSSSCDGLPPCIKPSLAFGTAVHGRKEVSLRSEVSSEDAVRFEKALRMLRRLEALHAALSLPGRLMRVLGTVVQIPALSMSHTR